MQVKENKQEFVNQITNGLSKYKNERKATILKLIQKPIAELIFIFILLIGLIFIIGFNIFFAALCLIIALPRIINFFYIFSEENKKFKKFLKQKYTSIILKTFNLSKITDKGFTKKILKKSNLFADFDKQKNGDVLIGNYKDVDYMIAETNLSWGSKEEEVCGNSSRPRKNTTEIFNGVIISFKTNKKITSKTLVTSQFDIKIKNNLINYKGLIALIAFITFMWISPNHSKVIIEVQNLFFNSDWRITTACILAVLGVFAFMIADYIEKEKLQDVKLEDISFDKRFNVYTKDQVEARYLTTPTFMERLKSLETAFGTKGIKCAFFDDCIMFAIPAKKDLFELGSLYKSLNSSKQVEEFYDELNSIREMIDHMKLNKKNRIIIWT